LSARTLGTGGPFMPIEFRCTCGKLLRTPENTAGKQARCPACGSVLRIPVPPAEERLPPPIPEPAAEQRIPQPIPVPVAPSPFAPPAAVASDNPYQSPQSAGAATWAPVSAAEGVEIRPTRLNLSRVFSIAWRAYMSRMGLVLAAMAVTVVLLVIFGGITEVLVAAVDLGGGPLVAALKKLVLSLPADAFGGFMNAGLAIITLKVVRGRDARFLDLFAGGPYVVPLFIISTCVTFGAFGVTYGLTRVATVLATGSTLAVVVGGIVLAVAAAYFLLGISQVHYVVVDRNPGVLESLKLSLRITRGNKLLILAIFFVMGLVHALAMLPGVIVMVAMAAVAGYFGIVLGFLFFFGVQIFIVPYTVLLLTSAYLWMSGQAPGEEL
jgi:hypothetical protein